VIEPPDRLERAAIRARWAILAFLVAMYLLGLRGLLARAATSSLVPEFVRAWLTG
jgi:hypothetical protein